MSRRCASWAARRSVTWARSAPITVELRRMNERRNLLQESLATIERLQARLTPSERAKHEPIAIVGVGCRFPGAPRPRGALARWCATASTPSARCRPIAGTPTRYYDPDPQAPGKMITRRGGFLDAVDRFDAAVLRHLAARSGDHGSAAASAARGAWEALESAGIATDRLAGSATGVFVGITTSDYGQLLRLRRPASTQTSTRPPAARSTRPPGGCPSPSASRGPACAVDTACSSSLVAVHLACQSLRAGECDLALAGGVNVDPVARRASSCSRKWGMMAPDGRCKTFDAAADGFVRAEGCGVVVLKRLSDALAAGDPILAVIRGSAVNPGRPQQRPDRAQRPGAAGGDPPGARQRRSDARRHRLRRGARHRHLARRPDRGRGARRGDAARAASPDRPLLVGSVKTNIGHPEAAAGRRRADQGRAVAAARGDSAAPALLRRRTRASPGTTLPVARAHGADALAARRHGRAAPA